MRVGRREPDLRMEGELALARPELDLDRAQRQAERDHIAAHDFQDRLDLIEARLGEILIAGREQRSPPAPRPASVASAGSSRGFSILKTWNSTSSPAM